MKKCSFCLLSVLTLSLFFISCSKDKGCSYTESNTTASAAEITYLQDYITNNAITATQHAIGFFYTINSPGSGATPALCSNITIDYTGFLLAGGSQFGAENGASYPLGQLIKGWQKGLPLIKSGGTITLYIPPSLAYGATDVVQNGVVVVPANSYLKFIIHLVDVQ